MKGKQAEGQSRGMSTASSHQIVLVHGRGAKPKQEELITLWTQALRAGLKRDAPKQIKVFDQAEIHMVYYADHLKDFVEDGFNEHLDLDNRRQDLEALAAKEKAKDFRRKFYEAQPGKTPLKEFAMDLSASIGLGAPALRKVLPELQYYWDEDNPWPSSTRTELASLLQGLLAKNHNVLLLSHCLGSVVAWDSLWYLSHQLDQPTDTKRMARWITFGSPLGARAVQKKLAGQDQQGARRYPSVLNAWDNLSAEDDYICHDKSVADDYNPMLEQRMIGDIRDHTIYNLSVRYGRSSPHSSTGYLIHPRMSALIADWLKSKP